MLISRKILKDFMKSVRLNRILEIKLRESEDRIPYIDKYINILFDIVFSL
jgi:hypothetical protein